MRAPSGKHAKEGIHSTVGVLCLVIVLISTMTLGSLRLYGLYLEHRLADVTSKMQVITDKNTVLEERYSSLLSPARIYTIARTNLKMMTAQEVQVILVDDASENNAGAKGTVARAPSKPGLLEFFVKTANAKD